jgi:Tfp pilus assembly protein PilV
VAAPRSRPLFARLRDERGFGMVELIAAMTIMVVGLLAVFAMFQAGMVELRQASRETTAAALADSEMENFRAVRYDGLGLDALQTCPTCAAADTLYRGDKAYRPDNTVTTTVGGAGIDADDTTLIVAGFAGFPGTAEYRVKIDSEVLLVTAGAGTTNWTVKRAQDGTMGAVHFAAATVTLKERVDVPACPGSPCTNLVPTKQEQGADGRSYRVDTYATWSTVTNSGGTAGRAVKQITVVVRDLEEPTKVWARLVSIFDESTGL